MQATCGLSHLSPESHHLDSPDVGQGVDERRYKVLLDVRQQWSEQHGLPWLPMTTCDGHRRRYHDEDLCVILSRAIK